MTQEARVKKIHKQLSAAKQQYASAVAKIVVKNFKMTDAVERLAAFSIAYDVALAVAYAIAMEEASKKRDK